ncbi:sulfite exporter TauE/SafE family protein [Cytobacillus sp. S13-E01]|uniref:urease accessory protein UreH domain-containing protein n=1 Tax=Cytobacillus sp. S13-E01 TaxID=3031326 RepID=UPI0023D861E6|nr:sulfite exporter TauE/SafE family protein [Cytobacillus sp. S13-E01]MDF0728110.1 sulfite exporter TauE/SafE family protein [Cytobacillus sp. S13-E01]
MYQFMSEASNLLSKPFMNIFYSLEGLPLLAALLLGLVGALAPCQITGNLGAIAIYGNSSVQKRLAWTEVLFFTLGKIVVFSGLGFLVWQLGQEFRSNLTLLFPWIRKSLGPILIIIGIYLAGYFKMSWTLTLGKVPNRLVKKGKLGAFLLGVSFSLGFCPTMFVLFFVTLMPIVLSTPYGAVLPSIFAIGTSIPLILAIFLIWYYELGSIFIKKSRKLGSIVQKSAGWIMIVLGIIDTLTYWL